jgi:hypothetical protein
MPPGPHPTGVTMDARLCFVDLRRRESTAECVVANARLTRSEGVQNDSDAR